MAKVQLPEHHRTVGDLDREPANVPTGVWELRAIKLSQRDITKKNKEGEEYETIEYRLDVEPMKASSGVNPDELNELDERTGKPVYEGKRLFLRYCEAFRGEMKSLHDALSALGFGKNDDFDVVIEKNLVRGRTAKGEIYNRTYTKNDGTPGTEQKVKSWAPVGASAAMAL